MSQAQQLLVFSDLDGTLLDHESYSWEAARPAVEALRRHDIPLVPVSSKTRVELESLRADLDNPHPYIVENGAAIYIPTGYFSDLHATDDDQDEHFISAGPTRDALQDPINLAREERGFRFKSFTELGTSEICWLTGLSQDAAEKANTRAASEPLLWQDNETRLQEFSKFLDDIGLRCIRGGRFVHVMGQFDKADAVARLVSLYAQKYPGVKLTTVALGDGPNDLQMLAQADIAVVIRGKHAFDMTLESQAHVMHPTAPGPTGWNEAILSILHEHIPEA